MIEQYRTKPLQAPRMKDIKHRWSCGRIGVNLYLTHTKIQSDQGQQMILLVG
jgi:hypothetical protein